MAFRFNPYSEPKRSSQEKTNIWKAVLNRVRPSSALQTLSICVYRSFLHGEIRNGSDRIGLLDLLFGDEMPVIFSGFPELRQLHIILEDNDPEYDSGWWTAEVIRRLPPRCHATVSVEVELCSYSMSCRAVCMTVTNTHPVHRAASLALCRADRRIIVSAILVTQCTPSPVMTSMSP